MLGPHEAHDAMLVSMGPGSMSLDCPTDRVRAGILHALGRTDEAIQLMETVRVHLAREGMVGHQPRTACELAELLLARGRAEDRPRARALLAEAAAVAEEKALVGLVPRIARAASRS